MLLREQYPKECATDKNRDSMPESPLSTVQPLRSEPKTRSDISSDHGADLSLFPAETAENKERRSCGSDTSESSANHPNANQNSIHGYHEVANADEYPCQVVCERCGYICQGCGKPFTPSAKSIKYGTPRVCSKACAARLGDHKRGQRQPQRRTVQWVEREDGTATLDLGKNRTLVVDRDILPLISSFRCYAKNSGNTVYARTTDFIDGEQKSFYLHHFVCGKPLPGYETDHRDGNGLNNTRGNLRTVTVPQNRWNSRNHADSRSRYRGVTWSKALNKWSAKFRRCRCGHYFNEADAARAWDREAFKTYGEFGRFNFPDELRAHHNKAFEIEVAANARLTPSSSSPLSTPSTLAEEVAHV